MALTVPSGDELLRHMHRVDEFSDDEEDWTDDALQQATDLMTMATTLTEDPTDELLLRVVNRGILAMAHALFVQSGDREAMYSPFSSERIGSYSYTKAQAAAAAGQPTGIVEFDTAVQYVRDQNTVPWTTSEAVTVTEAFTDSDSAAAHSADSLDGGRDVVLHPDAYGR